MSQGDSPKRIKTKLVKGKRSMDYAQELWEVPGGKKIWRDVVKHKGAVAIFCLRGKGKRLELLMQYQYRYPYQKNLWEVPAGTMDPGESPQTTARRELLEETGYRAASLRKFGRLLPAPGYCDEVIHLYEANKLSYVGQELDEGELIHKVQWKPVAQILNWIRSGKIMDAKTVAGVLRMSQKI